MAAGILGNAMHGLRNWLDSLGRSINLIEFAVGGFAAALVLVVVLWTFRSNDLGTRTDQALEEVRMVVSAVHLLYAGKSRYCPECAEDGNIAPSLLSSHLLPTEMIGGQPEMPVVNAFGGAASIGLVQEQVAIPMFRLRFTNLPTAACVRLAGLDLGTALAEVDVNGVASEGGTYMIRKKAQPACEEGSGNSIVTWKLY